MAASPAAAGRGVLVVLNNQIQAAREVTKTSTSRLESFRSSDLGFLGYADSDGEVVFYRSPAKTHTEHSEFDIGKVRTLPRVDIALAYPGADGTVVSALARAGCAGGWSPRGWAAAPRRGRSWTPWAKLRTAVSRSSSRARRAAGG